jgi:biotin carboxylase
VSISKKVICEHYFEGKQYSVEMISQNGIHYFVGITEEFYSGPPFFVETGHIVPADIPDDILNKIIDIVKETLDVVKMDFGASHTEIRVNEKGEYCIIEIASRMGGDFRDLMVLNSYNYDFLKNVINVSIGKKIEIPEAIKYNYSFVKWVFSLKDIQTIKNKFIDIEVIEMNMPVEEEISLDEIKDSSKRLGYFLAKSSFYPMDFLI